MAYGFIPTAWRHIGVKFIPKPGKLDYTEAKAYHCTVFPLENDGETSEGTLGTLH
jgi:hypothetical protein